MKEDEVELVLDAKATLGEGAIWDGAKQQLYWVDILRKELHFFDPATRQDCAIELGQFVGTVVPRKKGGVILAVHHGIASLDFDSGDFNLLRSPEGHPPTNRFNDGKCDPAGRFWAGPMSLSDAPGAGCLYRVDADLSVHRMLDGVSVSNGIAWSADKSTMYYIDTPTRRIEAFDYDVRTGDIRNRRTAIHVPPEWGYPDGKTMDALGNLWVAMWGGHAVNCWNPKTGDLIARISLPVTNVTSCAFGGSNLDELYITTARAGVDEDTLRKEPLSGGIFGVRLRVQGTPAYAFAG